MTRHPARPDSLELLPGESAQPPLRLLERPALRQPAGLPMAPQSRALQQPRWLAQLRHVAWRALAQ